MSLGHLKVSMHRFQPVDSFDNLRERVERLIKPPARRAHRRGQLSLDLPLVTKRPIESVFPSQDVGVFLDFITDAVPEGDVYLFGGVLRDLALFGKKGFNSDIDLVVEGDWYNCVRYVECRGAVKNRFGGYRLQVGEWPVDIWNARETWAIRRGLVPYEGVNSLTRTTVLNWDAILMNWRTRAFVAKSDYLQAIQTRLLDIVLTENPNPLGMAVRIFRHLCGKDAARITSSAAEYLASCARIYSFDVLKAEEIRSYGTSIILPKVHRFFELVRSTDKTKIHDRFIAAADLVRQELELSP